MTQKYISLFPKTDDDESKKRRSEAMVKVLQIASHKQKIKDRDLEDDLMMDQGDGQRVQASTDDRVFGKDKDVA